MPSQRASCVYQLFQLYATWIDTTCTMDEESFGRLIFDLGLLEGIHPSHYAAYLQEHMRRADQDEDGTLSLNDFMIWFFSEAAAIVPVGEHSGRTVTSYTYSYLVHRGASPLYNQFVHYTSHGSGSGSTLWRTALQDRQFQQMCRHCEVFWTINQRAKVITAHSTGHHQRKTSQLETGSKLQLANMLKSLYKISERLSTEDTLKLRQERMTSHPMHAILYKLASGGQKPPLLSPASKPDPRQVFEDIQYCYLGGGLGNGHTLDTQNTEVYMKLRRVFHRHNRILNTGLEPPKQHVPSWASYGGESWEDEEPASPARSAAAAGASPTSSRGERRACCCMYQSLSLMELHTFRKLCTSCPAIALTQEHSDAQLLTQRIETAFLVASSVGGLSGHDAAVTPHDQPLPSNRPGTAHARLTPTANKIGPQPFALYATPFNISTISAAGAQRTVRLETIPATGTPGGSPGGSGSQSRPQSPRPASNSSPASSPRGTPRHRAAVPTLNFLQFIEALRLVAVYIAGTSESRDLHVNCGVSRESSESSSSLRESGNRWAQEMWQASQTVRAGPTQKYRPKCWSHIHVSWQMALIDIVHGLPDPPSWATEGMAASIKSSEQY